jgi:hypothetical protein
MRSRQSISTECGRRDRASLLFDLGTRMRMPMSGCSCRFAAIGRSFGLTQFGHRHAVSQPAMAGERRAQPGR